MEKELITAENTNRVWNDKNCIAYEYFFESENTSLAIIEIKERYPENCIARNKFFEEIILVLEGNGKIIIEGEKYKVGRNDAVLIKPNRKYYYEGNLKIATFCSPAFDPNNHEVITGERKN